MGKKRTQPESEEVSLEPEAKKARNDPLEGQTKQVRPPRGQRRQEGKAAEQAARIRKKAQSQSSDVTQFRSNQARRHSENAHRRQTADAHRILGNFNCPIKYIKVRVEDHPQASQWITSKKTVDLKNTKRKPISGALWLVCDRRNHKVVGVVRQTPFSEMDSKEISELDSTSRFVVKERRYCNPVTNNAAMLLGYMGVIGYRKAYTKEEVVGGYRPNKRVQSSPKLLARWWRRVLSRPRLEDYYSKRFEKLSATLYDKTRELARSLNIPTFGQIDHQKPLQRFGFGGNLSFTMDEFSNLPHTDNDVHGWTYGLFVPIYRRSGKLARHSDGYDVKDGNFFWPDLDVQVDFAACDGVTEILWRGSQDLHCTLPSKDQSGKFTRLGTSVQINARYAKACQAVTNVLANNLKPVNMSDQKTCVTQRKIERVVGSPLYLARQFVKNFKKKKGFF